MGGMGPQEFGYYNMDTHVVGFMFWITCKTT